MITVWLLMSHSSHGGTIVVDAEGGEDYTTIADALWVAGDGDTVVVHAGTYAPSTARSCRCTSPAA